MSLYEQLDKRHTQFVRKTLAMRQAQQQYFKSHSGIWLDKAKRLEREVDAMIKEEGKAHLPQQQGLF